MGLAGLAVELIRVIVEVLTSVIISVLSLLVLFGGPLGDRDRIRRIRPRDVHGCDNGPDKGKIVRHC